MKERKDDLLLSGKESGNDEIVIEKSKRKGDDGEDMMVDVVDDDAGCNVDLSLKVGFNSVRDQVMEEASDDMVESKVVSLEKDEVAVTVKAGNGPVVEDVKMEVREEIVEQAIESVEEATDEKVGKESEVLSSSKITEPLSTTASHGSPEGHVVCADCVEDKAEDAVKKGTEDDNDDERSENVEPQVGDDQTKKESLQSTIERTAKDSKMAVESLFTETHDQEVADVDPVTDEKDGVQDDSKKIAVIEEGVDGKDETQVGVSEDHNSPCTDNYSLSSDAVNAGTGEGDTVNEEAADMDQKAEVVEKSKEENSQSTMEVITDKNLDQKAEVVEKSEVENSQPTMEVITDKILDQKDVEESKEENSQPTMEVITDKNLDQKVEVDEMSKDESSESTLEVKTDDALKSGEGTGVGDSKMEDESISGDTEIADEEIDVIDKPEETESKEPVEQPTDSVQVACNEEHASNEDHVMAEKSGKETEVLNSSIIPESSSAVASLELEEVDVVVVEEKGLEEKNEAQDGDSVELGMVVNPGTGEDAVQVTEASDQKAEVDTTNKNESSLATIEVDEVATAPVVACTEPDSSINRMEIETETSKVEPPASGDASNFQEDQGLIIAANVSNDQSLVSSGNEATAPDVEVPTTGGLHAYAEHGVLPADSEFSYEEGHMERGEDAGMDIDEVLGWKDEIKVDPTVFSLESEQWNETFASLQQSCYFQPPETEGEFSVSDLVWGKVRSHPWWPGQIFDPSDASEEAMKYHKKDCFLVAYFGDRTFAWNESTVLKPFRSQFSDIEKHENSEAFSNAVHCALEEVSRRVELGLACTCIPQNIFENIKYQIVENSGISLEASRRRGIDKSASVSSFEPHKLVDYMRLLAKFPYGEGDKMELTLAKAQLLSYGRYKGYRQLAEFQLCGDLLEEDETYSEDGSKKRKALDSISDGLEKRPTLHAEKPSFKVGACIQKVASQLSGPPLADHVAGNDVLMQSPGSTRLGNQAYEDRIVQNHPDESMLQENQNGGVEQHQHQQHQLVSYEQQHQQQYQQQPVKQTRRSNKKRFFSSNHEIEAKEQSELIERRRQNLATEVLMKYTEGIYFPSEIHLNKMFKRFGPLMESETEVNRQIGRARVVFKKCSDAEVAHSSAGKFNIFGSISVNYELNYTPLISYKPMPLPIGQDPAC